MYIYIFYIHIQNIYMYILYTYTYIYIYTHYIYIHTYRSILLVQQMINTSFLGSSVRFKLIGSESPSVLLLIFVSYSTCFQLQEVNYADAEFHVSKFLCTDLTCLQKIQSRIATKDINKDIMWLKITSKQMTHEFKGCAYVHIKSNQTLTIWRRLIIYVLQCK